MWTNRDEQLYRQVLEEVGPVSEEQFMQAFESLAEKGFMTKVGADGYSLNPVEPGINLSSQTTPVERVALVSFLRGIELLQEERRHAPNGRLSKRNVN